MSSWPGAGAAITRVYEAKQGVSKEMMSKMTGMIELTMGDIIIAFTLGLFWPPLFHLRLHVSGRSWKHTGNTAVLVETRPWRRPLEH